MTWLFSNQHRLQKLGISFILLLGLCTYTNIKGNRYALEKVFTLEQCLINPIACAGRPLVMRVQINHSTDGSFIAYPKIWGEYQLGYPVVLAGGLKGIQHGYIIDILGAYSLDSTFIVARYQRNDWVRPVKYAVSLLGLLLAVILLYRRYRLSPDRQLPLIHR